MNDRSHLPRFTVVPRDAVPVPVPAAVSIPVPLPAPEPDHAEKPGD